MEKSGFTLIELLVTLAVIGILSVLAFVSLRNFRQDEVIKDKTSQLQSLLTQTQNLATSRVLCGVNSGATWLVEFKTDQKTFEVKCYIDPLATKTFIKSLSFSDSSVIVSSIKGQSGSCPSTFPSNIVSVEFAPLYGTLSFKDFADTTNCLKNSSDFQINLTDQTGNSKVVTIRSGGVINVQ